MHQKANIERKRKSQHFGNATLQSTSPMNLKKGKYSTSMRIREATDNDDLCMLVQGSKKIHASHNGNAALQYMTLDMQNNEANTIFTVHGFHTLNMLGNNWV